MITKLFHVVDKSAPMQIKGKDGSTFNKCTYHLKTFEGDEILAVAFREEADKPIRKDNFVAASIYFNVSEYDGRLYQENRIREIVALEPKLEY